MQKISILALVVSVIMLSCKPGTDRALAFSDKIVGLETSLEAPIAKAENAVDSFVVTKNYAAIVQPATEMENQVQSKIDELKKLEPDGKGGDVFKNAAIEYFGQIKSIYTKYKELGTAKTDDERATILQSLNDINTTTTNAVNKMQAAQKLYASQNGFEVGK